ncbi:MAG: DegT/DnrJ/EryC1/StrS family aminotransferase, partial [Tannerellaceae bacterium]|nr:DegT/DnrJ/EryC1/StrS family aminotransferase [Tannerellaceae bacterium]
MEKELITVTSPLIPPLDELIPYLEDIWKSRRITNEGKYHAALEEALREYLHVPYVSLLTNGTIALTCALKALDITGEVITTPYSFVATAHALSMNGLRPVFADISPLDLNLNPDKIEQAITSETGALLPVHVYGNPCQLNDIREIARKHNLKLIYDAAHAFGVNYENRSLLLAGDLSVLSFNATKVYNTVEGGAVISHDRETKRRIDRIRSFGFATETDIIFPGTNGKIDEIRSAYGLAGLSHVKEAIDLRRQTAGYYRKALEHIAGISLPCEEKEVTPNYSYFPIFIDPEEYGISRDDLYEKMKKENILCRRYFYPLISSFSPYKDIPSANPE